MTTAVSIVTLNRLETSPDIQHLRHDNSYGRMTASRNLDECHLAVKHGDPSSNDFAQLTNDLAVHLLPRRRDRLYRLLPPQAAWRMERYIFGMHK